MEYFIGIFCILHGLVHFLYMGHGLNYFELEKGFTWPDNSRLLNNIFSLKKKRLIAGVLCAVAALSFVISGICVLTGCSWQKPETIVAVTTSTILFIAFWDGSLNKWHTQGGIAILINLVIFAYTLI